MHRMFSEAVYSLAVDRCIRDVSLDIYVSEYPLAIESVFTHPLYQSPELMLSMVSNLFR